MSRSKPKLYLVTIFATENFKRFTNKKVKSHIRVVPIVGVALSGRIIITAGSGKPYANKSNLPLENPKKVNLFTFKAGCFIADKCKEDF